MASGKLKEKNFSYGELWPGVAPAPNQKGTGRVEVKVEDFTNSSAFTRYMEKCGYKLYLDYGTSQVAFTDVTNKCIVLNGNYEMEMLEACLQHELGHLMLFDVNQFTTVRPNTLRSIISSPIYTGENVRKYGIEQLLRLENIVQDIIIETVAEGNCLCHQSLIDNGENIGVKHLETLEAVYLIAKEAVKTVPQERDTNAVPEGLKDLLDSLLEQLQNDIQDIEDKIEKTKETKEYQRSKIFRRHSKSCKLKQKIERVDKRLKRNPERADKLNKLRDKLQDQLNENDSEETAEQDRKDAEEQRQKDLESLNKSLQEQQDLKDALEQELENLDPNADSGKPGEPGQGQNGEEAEPTDDANTLTTNETDHLLDMDQSENTSQSKYHSYDCGFPHPTTIAREDSYRNEVHLKRLSGRVPKRSKVVLDEDIADNVQSNRIKTTENDLTYFKSGKKEFSPSDMLKGKRRLRVSGINVLIGLDVSGSMSREWTTMFREISDLVLKLQETLDIENIVFFTYHHNLVKYSTNLEDLDLRARGGNAFSYVYVEMMKKLPIMKKNEIILVTDCGDNLGFPLNDVVEVSRGGDTVENHISIIDTEGSGFYDKDSFNEDEWSLYPYGDKQLHAKITENITGLIG